MLKSVDVLLGLIVVLLALSMAVTVITQSITSVLNTRGRHLRRGLTDLLQQLDPALTATFSRAVATALLTHPLVSGSNTPVARSEGANPGQSLVSRAIDWLRRLTGGPRLGNVVHREEFTKLLLALGAGHGASGLTAAAKTALKTALSSNGVADPEETLKTVRTLALQFERSDPSVSHVLRQNLALLTGAESDLVAKINSWFDQTMDRTSQRFTASTRAITFAGAFIVAVGLQVDSLSIVNRLAADDAMRDAFVVEAKALDKASQATSQTATAPAPVSPDQEMDRKYRAFLAENGVIRLPGAAGWWQNLRTASVGGIFVTALLLSLGAPFWYSALGQLLQLRSVLAAKDDAQRLERQGSSAPSAGSRTATPGASNASGQAGG